MTSLWLDRPRTIEVDPFVPDASYDTIVVGGGLTGLCTALLLARSGESVAVIEAAQLASVTTGNTTGKLSLLHGGQLSKLAHHNSAEVARAYVEANLEGQKWLLRYCVEHELPFQTRDAFTYAGTADGAETVQKELEACQEAGLTVTHESETGLPFPSFGAVRLADQAQINPLDIVECLARDVRERRGRVIENTRVTNVAHHGDGVEVTTSAGGDGAGADGAGRIRAQRVVLATGTPILARGAHFARLEPSRSYALAFTVPGPIPEGMYLSIDEPGRSLRTARIGETEYLIVGGNGHPVGREHSPAALVRDLEEWTLEHFPGAVRTHSWSAQDYRSLDYAPYVGAIVPGDERIFVATGFNKWGMTNAVAASLALSSQLLDGEMEWARTLYGRPVTLSDAADAAGLGASVGALMVKDWLAQTVSRPPASPPSDGEGVVYREGMSPVGMCRIGGSVSKVSGVCTHLGGVLGWNDAEQSWDCPLHGSRFSHDGQRLEGPALRDLEQFDVAEQFADSAD